MVTTLEVPFHPIPQTQHYEQRFGALPDWVNDLSNRELSGLVRHALNSGVPITQADAWIGGSL